MKFFIDTANIEEIKEVSKWGVLSGVTTNPSLIAKEGRKENIVIKIPMTSEGLKAIKVLSEKGIKTNCTLIFSANQALLAAKAGATFVSPFIGRLDDIGNEGMMLIRDVAEIFDIHGINTEIIAASIRHPMHVTQSALAGAHIATVPYGVFQKMLKHPLTDIGIEKFNTDWEKVK